MLKKIRLLLLALLFVLTLASCDPQVYGSVGVSSWGGSYGGSSMGGSISIGGRIR